MKILLLGNTGQLGWELERTLQPLGEVLALDYPAINMADEGSVSKAVQTYHPEMIVNATAYTAVDKAESEPELAEAINGTGPGILAEEARKLNAFLIHYSTDYVFDGKKGTPYIESDQINPLSVYGASKLKGEQVVRQVDGDYLIFRTSWVYSLRQESGFVKKALQWSRQQDVLRVVDDQVSNPTWARKLAEVTTDVLRQGQAYVRARSGLYHLAGKGFTSRYDWVKQILALDPNRNEQKIKEILRAKSADFPVTAERPIFSALNCDLFEEVFGITLSNWEDDLKSAIEISK
jgi:dTDP-4-dehydrorhamnose reductase